MGVFLVENMPVSTTLTDKGYQRVLMCSCEYTFSVSNGKDTTVCAVSQALWRSVISVRNSSKVCKISPTAATIRLAWPCYTMAGWKCGKMLAHWPTWKVVKACQACVAQ